MDTTTTTTLGPIGTRIARAHSRLMSLSIRARHDDGGQHAEEGALIGTLVALGAGAVVAMPKVGEAIGTMWSTAVGG